MSLQELSGSSPKRRRAEEKDEGIGSPDMMEEEKVEELRREMLELRQQLDKERSARMQLEDQVRLNQKDCLSPRGRLKQGVGREISFSFRVTLNI